MKKSSLFRLFLVLPTMILSSCANTDSRYKKFSKDDIFVKIQYSLDDEMHYEGINADGYYMNIDEFVPNEYTYCLGRFNYTPNGNYYINALINENVYYKDNLVITDYGLGYKDDGVPATGTTKDVLYAMERLTSVGIHIGYIYETGDDNYFVRVRQNVNWLDAECFYYYNKDSDSLILLRDLKSSKSIRSFGFLVE